MTTPQNKGVLVVYTGGTVGSVHRKRANHEDPLVPGSAQELLSNVGVSEEGLISYKHVDVPVSVVTTKELIDSTNITTDTWVEIARLIEDNYEDYCGFVILHGTDTMAFTASALSFMFSNLSKPVVLTGAQKPIGEVRSDALQNIITSIEIAAAELLGNTVIPEVSLFFHDRLLRGCRATKTSATSFMGFDSPNCAPLAVAGERIIVNTPILRPGGQGPLQVQYGIVREIAVLHLTPLMSYQVLEEILSVRGLRGLIIAAYGVGNVPENDQFIGAIKSAQEKGIKIAVVTQCGQGSVALGRYQVSASLLECGVISCLDMTKEAAQTKMAILLHGDHSAAVEDLMSVNIRGELSESLFNLRFAEGSVSSKDGIELSATSLLSEAGQAAFTRGTRAVAGAQLRFVNADVSGQGEEPVQIQVTAVNSRNERGKLVLPFTWSSDEGETTIIANITSAIRQLSYWNESLKIRIETTGEGVLSWKRMDLSIFEKS